MSRTFRNPPGLRRAWRAVAGQGLVEFAVIFPILATIIFSVIELGNAYGAIHALAGISREGANIAARGATPAEVMNVVMTSGSDINLPSRGGAILTRAVILPNGDVSLQVLQNSGCVTCLTRLEPETFEPFIGTHYAVEVFYDYGRVTPLSNFVDGLLPDPMYEYAVF